MTDRHPIAGSQGTSAPPELWDEQQFRALVANVPGAVYRFDPGGWKVQFLSAGMEPICGYPGTDFLGARPVHSFASILHPDDHDWCELHILDCIERGDPWDVEYRILHADGSVRWAHERGRAVYAPDGTPLFLDGLIFDITDRKQLEHQLQHLAYHDSLTGLANRSLFQEHVERALAQADREGRSVAVLFIDLDDFKQVNDSVGHSGGDALLCEVADRFVAVTRASDVVARQGGDEFLILMTDFGPPGEEVPPAEAAATLIARLHGALTETIVLADREMLVTASIGAASYPQEASSAEELLMRADSSMYASKREPLPRSAAGLPPQ